MSKKVLTGTLMALTLALSIAGLATLANAAPAASNAVALESLDAELALLGAGSFDFVGFDDCYYQCLSQVNCNFHPEWPPVPGRWCADGCTCQPCNGVWGCRQ